MADGVSGPLGPRPAQVLSSTTETEATSRELAIQPELPQIEHPRRSPMRFMSRLVTMTLIGASILLSTGAVLGANHAPAEGGPLTEARARSSVDSARYVSTRPLVKVLLEARSQLADVELERRGAEQDIRWHRKLLERIDAGEMPVERRSEALEVIARETERLGGISRDLATAKARVARAEQALAPWIAEAKRSLSARGLPDDVRDSSPHQLIDAAAIAEAWMNRHGSLPARTDAIYWLLSGGDTDAILTALAEHPKPLYSDPAELSAAAGPLDQLGWQRAQALHDRFEYRPDARDLAALGSLDNATFDRLLSLFAELEATARFSVTDGVGPATFGPTWSRTHLVAMMELLAADQDGRPGFWLDSPASFFAQRATFELSAFVEAAKLFTDRTGLPFTADHLAVTALLASSLEPEKQAALFLLDHVSLRARGETEQLGLVARRAGPEGRALDEASFSLIREASARLGRKLTVGEVGSLVTAKLPLDEVLPPVAVEAALRVDPNASLQDIALLAKTSAVDPKALLERIERRLTPGASRRDRAAEYPESWAASRNALSYGDLVRVDLLLTYFRSEEGRTAVSRAVSLDLEEPNAEAGGRIDLSGGKPTLRLVASDGENNNSYVYPDAEKPLLFALVPFHLHAIHADGNPHSAGPSSAYGGITGDRAASRNRGLAEVVITHLDGERFGVDYYTPSGAVVDLGTFAYPK